MRYDVARSYLLTPTSRVALSDLESLVLGNACLDILLQLAFRCVWILTEHIIDLDACPDVLLLDIRMPDFDALKKVPDLRARFPGMKIVIMTAYESEFYAQTLMAHVDGYLLKRESMETFATAVQEVSRGRRYLSNQTIDLAFNNPEVKLSERETEALQLAAQGKKTAEIAQEMFISDRTVESHIQLACQKLGVRGRTAAVARAIERGLITAGGTEDNR